MKTLRTRHWRAAGFVVMFTVLQTGLHGCGDPEPPEIKDVQITYWDGSVWQPLNSLSRTGGEARGSPVAIGAEITDNTAVVRPHLSLTGSRQDTAPWTGACSFVTIGAEPYCVFEPIPLEDPIRGDRFTFNLTASAAGTGQTTPNTADFQAQIRVKEALALDTSGEVIQEYRIFKITSLKGSPNPYLWAFSRSLCPRDACPLPAAGDLVPLQSGDSLELLDGSGQPLELAFRFLVKAGPLEVRTAPDSSVTYRLDDASLQSAEWKSLVKWDQDFNLFLDAKTGSFKLQFVLFDPRSLAASPTEGPPLYQFIIRAEDVPDESDGEVRSSSWGYDPPFRVAFSPPDVLPEDDPVITIKELSEGAENQTSTALRSLTGKATSVAGEPKGLQFVLSNCNNQDEAGVNGCAANGIAYEQRVYSFDPEQLALGGTFSSSTELVSDWTQSISPEAGGIYNHLEVLAIGMRERAGGVPATTRFTHDFQFVPPSLTQSAPSLQFLDIFPALNASGQSWLPLHATAAPAAEWTSEPLRIRALAADDGGQPRVSYWWSTCSRQQDVSNPTQARCRGCETGDMAGNDLDATGQFPANPWRTMEVLARNACPEEIPLDEECSAQAVAVVKASERQTHGELPLFAAAAILLQQDFQDGPFTVNKPATVAHGPSVSLGAESLPQNGQLVASGSDVELTALVSANTVPLNRVFALADGSLPATESSALPVVTAGDISGMLNVTWSRPGGAHPG